MKKLITLTMAIGIAFSGSSLAKIDAEQAKKLSTDLTPLGAVRAANADGSIPAWSGGITEVPAGYSPGMHHLDPFPNDKI
jgi:hypothetical protein